MQANILKSVGYLISTASVILLALVAWDSAAQNPALRTALICGVALSIAGMFLRWLSYQVEAKDQTGSAASASAPRHAARPR